jgi:hypothetical protein
MSDDLQVFIEADREELIGSDLLGELRRAARQGVRAGTYMFGLDVLGAAPILHAEMTSPGSTNASPVAIANRLKSNGQLAVEAGQRAIASSRRYRAGKKLGQKAIEAGKRALEAGKKVKAVGDAAAKAAALRTAGANVTSQMAQAATAAARPAARTSLSVKPRAAATVAPRTAATAPTKRIATRVRGVVVGADEAKPEALEAAAAAWADMAKTVERLNIAGEAAAQVADQADKLGVDATPVRDALMEAFSEEPYRQGFVVQWANYAYGPEIAEGAAEARVASEQWIAKLNPLVEKLKRQLTQTPAAPTDQKGGGALPSTPGRFDPGTPGGGGAFPSDDSGDGGEGGGTSSETLRRFRESGGTWDPFEDAEFYVEEDGEEYAPNDPGVPGGFSAKRDARAAAIANTFETDEDAQAFVQRRSLLEDDSEFAVEDTLAGLDFKAQYIFMPHTAIVDWQKEKDAQLAAGNEAAQQSQVEAAQLAAALAAAKQSGTKLSPAVAMRLAAARRHLAEARARLAQANAAEEPLVVPSADDQ